MRYSLTYAWCPLCGYWVPSELLHSWYDKELDEAGVKAKHITNGIVNICSNCLEATPDNPFPVWKPQPWNYDPHYEDIQCIYCGSYNTEPVTDTDIKHYWRCKDCGEKFVYLPY